MRALIWPWHGRIQNNQIHLPGGLTRSYSQGSDTTTSASAFAGPGDTHLVKVPDIDPITPAEAELAPAGGEWWAGQALISAGKLYGKDLDGWIYQGAEGARWMVKLRDVVMTSSNTAGEIVTRRFGELGAEPQEQIHDLDLGYGYGSAVDAQRLLLHHRPTLNGLLRLHSVSETGQHAVLALMAYNSANWSPSAQLDRRPRAYRFYLATIDETEEGLSVDVDLLYDIEAIRPPSVTTTPSPSSVVFSLRRLPGAELAREPAYDSSGRIGDRVTYAFDEHVEIGNLGELAGTQIPASGVYESTHLWMWGVRFDGDTPVPMYIRMHSLCTVEPLSLSWETITPHVRVEFTGGGWTSEVSGLASLVAPRTATTEFTIELLGAESAWSVNPTGETVSTLTFEAGMETVITPLTVNIEWTYDGASGSGAAPPADYASPGSVGFISSAASGNPAAAMNIGSGASTGAGGGELMMLDLFANNCLGVARGNYISASYVQALTPDGAVEAPADFSHTNQRRYGSYNPATGDVILAATSPVTWI